MLARVGSMIAPFIATGLSETAHWLPPVIFGIIPIVGAVLVLFLPGENLTSNRKILKYFDIYFRNSRMPAS